MPMGSELKTESIQVQRKWLGACGASPALGSDGKSADGALARDVHGGTPGGNGAVCPRIAPKLMLIHPPDLNR